MVKSDSQVLTSTVNSSSSVQSVSFSSNNSSVVTVNPSSDTTYAYQTTLSAVNTGNATITSNVTIGGVVACTGTADITVSPPGPWWQIKDSDISANGDIVSGMPTGISFDLDGAGGFPGVPVYAGTKLDLTAGSGTGTVSSKNWVANSSTLTSRVYDTNYFLNQIPGDAVVTTVPSATVEGTFFESGGTLSYGYYWYKYDGSTTGLNLTINSAMNLGSRKVILIVNAADVYLKGNINVTDAQGFFLLAAGKNDNGVKGDIFVDPSVGGGSGPNLEGIYLADNLFRTGTAAPTLDSKLYVRGSVAAYGGVVLDRDLGTAGNAANPSEFFEYAPDQVLLFPTKLAARRINWKEIAP
jgi:hypothetical protein